MLQVGQDLRDEAEELNTFLETLDKRDWTRATPFKNWTPWDVVAHLHFFDEVSLLSLNDPDAFATCRDDLVAKMAKGITLADEAKRVLGGLDAETLRTKWIESCREMADALGASEPKRRLPWFGPDMGVPMFTTARYMETWAHGQDIYDLLHHPRAQTDRIKHIAVIGMKTFGWTFVNRGEEIPGPPPYVRIDSPSGGVWEWGDPSDEEYVRGSAVEFCHVVTQGRNVADTSLAVKGPVATYWMSIAQCFAGAAVDPPKPGERLG
ncbi:MAG: TIGR03084 family metal-binding protein [Candidatus Binatia bacterium]|nr:TIGR03084 family metal-binding protein [Candidatus Binatia bacterium]